MPNYLISIIIPFYNTKSYFFKECLNSIVRQTYQNFECILVDDGTTNIETIKIAQKITVKDKFKLVRLHKNVGLGPARNAGIKHANGDIFVYVDSDDYIKSDILERINKIFNK
jgi:glycosyltransferase involved in cell wall biosynthesis